MSCNGGNWAFVGGQVRRELRSAWKEALFQILTRCPYATGHFSRSGSGPPPAIRAGAGSSRAGGPCRSHWGGEGSSPTSARATAGPPGALSGPGNCGGAPIAIRGRELSCPFAPSGLKMPGAKTPRAATTISRCGSTGHGAATGSGVTMSSMISLSRSVTTARRASRAAAARYSCIWRGRILRRRLGAFR